MVEPTSYPTTPPMPPWSNPIPGESGFLALYDEFVANASPDRVSIVVEVGLGIGHSIAHLLHRVVESGKPIRVVGVDPFWSTGGRNGEQQAEGNAAGGDFNLFLREFMKLDRKERERLELLRTSSELASLLFGGRTIDLVLIDGNHDYQYVFQDLEAWWPKVRGGGVLAGDDYCEPYGVIGASRDFFKTSVEVVQPRDGERGNPWFRVRKS
jgi:SAM-dependent methyltransferase